MQSSLFIHAILLFFIILLSVYLYDVIIVGNVVPKNYYSNETWQKEFTHEEVQCHLNYIRENIDFAEVYEYGYFDCSEMSAYLEWYFEELGANAVICTTSDHAWVRLEQLYNQDVNIESTGLYITFDPAWSQETSKYNSIHNIVFKHDYNWWDTEYAEVLKSLPTRFIV